jgi:predicted RNA binding protein YcfA (HicA-like mRNA interferase family)
MSEWPATKARRVLAALQRIGWRIVRLVEIARHTGLRPEDL